MFRGGSLDNSSFDIELQFCAADRTRDSRPKIACNRYLMLDWIAWLGQIGILTLYMRVFLEICKT